MYLLMYVSFSRGHVILFLNFQMAFYLISNIVLPLFSLFVNLPFFLKIKQLKNQPPYAYMLSQVSVETNGKLSSLKTPDWKTKAGQNEI